MKPFARASLLAVALSVLAPRGVAAQIIPFDIGSQPPTRSAQGMAGGPVPAQNADSRCRGYIPSQPQQAVVTRSGLNFLRVFVQSQTDTTLVVRAADGSFYCNDDRYGLNPGLDLTGLAPGRYDIFVGSYNASTMGPYAIYLSENPGFTPDALSQRGPMPMMPPPPMAPPNNGNNGIIVDPNAGGASGLHTELPPTSGRIVLPRVMRRPETRTARVADATINASTVRGSGVCRGWIARPPSFAVRIDTPQPFLRFSLASAADTVMVIQYPDGHAVCDDDSFGSLQPMIEGAFAPGAYLVWVGIYRSGMEHPYRMTITNDPARARP